MAGSVKVKRKKKIVCLYQILKISEKSKKTNFLTKVENYLENFQKTILKVRGGGRIGGSRLPELPA